MIRFEGRGRVLPALAAATLVVGVSSTGAAQTPPGTPAPSAPAAAAPSAPAPASVPVAAPRSVPGGASMSLEDCVQTALGHNVDALTSDFEVKGAQAERSGARGELGPKLRVEGTAQFWNNEFSVTFPIPTGTGAPASFPVRDQFTWNVSVSVIQPLTSLWAIYDQYKVRDLGVDVAKVQRDVTRRDVAFRVAESYMRLMEAQRLADVAGVSVTQLESQKRQAQSLYDNGVIGKNDFLRADLALADAKERVLRTEGNVVLARSRLATLMGTPEVNVMPMFTEGDPPATPESNMASAESHALSKRAELREVDARIEQADKRVGMASSKLIPQANLIGNYAHVAGSAFQQKDAAYVGVAASWDVWDWGTNISGINAAKARREQAILARTKIADQVRLEARQAFVDASTAREALEVAKAALSQAEENYRIVSKRFAANTATSFDNVDAESLLTQTRARVETALYGYHVARLALERATGEVTPTIR